MAYRPSRSAYKYPLVLSYTRQYSFNQPRGAVVRITEHGAHTAYLVTVLGRRYLFNGNDTSEWVGNSGAVNNLPPDGFHTAEFADCVRPWMARPGANLQQGEGNHTQGDCKALVKAADVIFRSAPGPPAERLRVLVDAGLTATGMNSFCEIAERMSTEGAGEGASSRGTGAKRGVKRSRVD